MKTGLIIPVNPDAAFRLAAIARDLRKRHGQRIQAAILYADKGLIASSRALIRNAAIDRRQALSIERSLRIYANLLIQKAGFEQLEDVPL
jgi:hypothetical protein